MRVLHPAITACSIAASLVAPNAPSSRAANPCMNDISELFANIGSRLGGGGASKQVGPFTDTAPSWADLKEEWDAVATDEERSFRTMLASGRLPHASALAKLRLFDLPDGEEPRVTLYRDTAAWCAAFAAGQHAQPRTCTRHTRRLC